MVPMGIESFLKEYICKESCLWKAIHAESNQDIDGSIRFSKEVKAILRDDFIGDVAEFEA